MCFRYQSGYVEFSDTFVFLHVGWFNANVSLPFIPEDSGFIPEATATYVPEFQLF
jgi:hypothetical protein